jgi:hypothetical protein
VRRWAWLRQILRSRDGVLEVAAVHGPFVWTVMSLVVIPMLVRRPPTINFRWWVQLVGHFPFVGLDRRRHRLVAAGRPAGPPR